MNIFNKIALQGMKKSRTRTFVTVIGVILSTTMITAVATFAISLQNYMINGSLEKSGKWHVAFTDADASFIKSCKQNNQVKSIVAVENIGYAALDGCKDKKKPYLFITGYSEDSLDSLPVNLISGRMPETSEEILIPTHVATKGGIDVEVGDTITLTIGERMSGDKTLNQLNPYVSGGKSGNGKETLIAKAEKTYRVVGTCQRVPYEPVSAPGFTAITKSDGNNTVESYSVFVMLKKARQVHRFASKNAMAGTYLFNDDVLRFMGLSDDKLFNSFLYSVGSILVILVMIGSVFLIYNSFEISLNERMHQFGILSSVGATSAQLRNSVLFEGLCIGAMGIPIGIMLGLGSIKFVLSAVSDNFSNILYNNVSLTLTISIPVIILAVMVSLITILISAYIPARKAANTPVMECIRQTNEVKIHSKDVKTSNFSQRIYGLEGILALKSFKRNKRRYRSIVLSLTLSVILFISANAFELYLKAFAKQSIMLTDCDICITFDHINDGEMFRLYDKLNKIDDVTDSSYQALSWYTCTVNAKQLTDKYKKAAGIRKNEGTVDLPAWILFYTDDTYADILKDLNLNQDEFTGENPRLLAIAKNEDPDDAKGDYLDIFNNKTMNLSLIPKHNKKNVPAKNVPVSFIDVIPGDSLPTLDTQPADYSFVVCAPYSQKGNFENEFKGLKFKSKNPSNSEEKMRTLLQSAEISSQYNLYNMSGALEQNRNIIFIVDVFTYVFVVMISLIATANVFNTISTNIKLRRRELSMLRSVGMSDRDFQKMMNFECVLYGVRTLVYGLPLAAIISYLIYKGMVAGGMDIAFIFPWESTVISILGVFFIVFITMLYSTSKLKRENIIDALQDDMG